MHVGPVHLEASLAVAFGKVHRKIGVAKQIVGVVLRALAEGDADAGPHRSRSLSWRRNVGVRASAMRSATYLRCFGHRSRLDEHRELVATEAGDGVTGPGGRFEPAGDGDEQVVSGRVPEAVVDGFEVVDVQEEHGDRVDAAVASVHGVGEPVEEQGAVGQAR